MDILNHPLFAMAIVVCLIGEFLISIFFKKNNYSLYESFSSLTIIAIDRVLSHFTDSDSSSFAHRLWNHRLFDMPSNRAVGFALTFVAAEFVYYWAHRYNHSTNLGWSTHTLHHSPTKFNFTMGYRLGVTKFISLAWVFFVPLALLGFEPKSIVLSAGIILLYQFFIHTELVSRLGFLESFLNTPSNHRVHHGDYPELYDKNLGGITVIFDRVFGTYAPEPKTGIHRYGFSEIMAKRNIFYEIFCHWSRMLHALARARGIKEAFLAVFGSPARLLNPMPVTVAVESGRRDADGLCGTEQV